MALKYAVYLFTYAYRRAYDEGRNSNKLSATMKTSSLLESVN